MDKNRDPTDAIPMWLSAVSGYMWCPEAAVALAVDIHVQLEWR